MGKRRGGGGPGGKFGGGGGGDYGDEGPAGGDQYGSLWSGGDGGGGGGGRGGKGGSGGAGGSGPSLRGGGEAGSRSSGPQLTAARVLPKFLQPHAHLLERAGRGDPDAPVVEDYNSAAQRRAGAFGDEDDVEAAARCGLGGRSGTAQRPREQGPFAGVDTGGLCKEDAAALRLAASLEAKAKGNRAFSEKRFADATEHFSTAIALSPTPDAVLFSNRSASRGAACDWAAAAEDAAAAVLLRPEWGKARARVAAAHLARGRFGDAADAFKQAAEREEEGSDARRAHEVAAGAARAKERDALRTGKFVFQPKTGAESGGGGAATKRQRVGAAPVPPDGPRAVRDVALLSFADDG